MKNRACILCRQGARAGLRIRWDRFRDFYAENLYVFQCKTPKEARDYYAQVRIQTQCD